jgi:hypothetical protein
LPLTGIEQGGADGHQAGQILFLRHGILTRLWPFSVLLTATVSLSTDRLFVLAKNHRVDLFGHQIVG